MVNPFASHLSPCRALQQKEQVAGPDISLAEFTVWSLLWFANLLGFCCASLLTPGSITFSSLSLFFIILSLVFSSWFFFCCPFSCFFCPYDLALFRGPVLCPLSC